MLRWLQRKASLKVIPHTWFVSPFILFSHNIECIFRELNKFSVKTCFPSLSWQRLHLKPPHIICLIVTVGYMPSILRPERSLKNISKFLCKYNSSINQGSMRPQYVVLLRRLYRCCITASPFSFILNNVHSL